MVYPPGKLLSLLGKKLDGLQQLCQGMPLQQTAGHASQQCAGRHSQNASIRPPHRLDGRSPRIWKTCQRQKFLGNTLGLAEK